MAKELVSDGSFSSLFSRSKESHISTKSLSEGNIYRAPTRGIYPFLAMFCRTELFLPDFGHLSFLTYGPIFSFLVYLFEELRIFARASENDK